MELFILLYWVLVLTSYVFFSYCNYLLSKKLDVKYPWMAFVPVLQFINILYLGEKTIKWGLIFFIFPVLISALVPSIGGYMQAAGTIDNIDIIKAISTIVVIVMCVSWLYATIALCHSISKRTGHGKWWTAGLILVSWLFFPVTAFHYEKGDEITPRPLTGVKKFFLIFFSIGLPLVVGGIGILAAALFPSLNSYAARGRDTARVSGIHEISTALQAYGIDQMRYPPVPVSGCIPAKDLSPSYLLRGALVDPSKKVSPGCDASDEQTYAYRTGTRSDGKSYFVVGAKMEGTKSGNSDMSIDEITPDSILIRGSGNMYYLVDTAF